MTDHLPSANTITTPLVLDKAKLPFRKKNRNTWTENQRAKAAMAPVARSLDNLQNKLNKLHAGGKVKSGKYVEINTSILEDKPLYIRDANGNLLSLALRAPEHIKKAIEDAILLIQAAMLGEFKDEDSRRALFKYHCHNVFERGKFKSHLELKMRRQFTPFIPVIARKPPFTLRERITSGLQCVRTLFVGTSTCVLKRRTCPLQVALAAAAVDVNEGEDAILESTGEGSGAGGVEEQEEGSRTPAQRWVA
ncbi:hypothetical protein B0H17DRAFT_1123846 [Mycena rosella]|uniref:Uncharacterized protein n=1 Tax=Mycena rosella TaxID=1033263 RepID=A0AAD7MCL1_MYCRO|nr:hypothetical protein B0H17DRAFT_1123846 [Mycena rosella]